MSLTYKKKKGRVPIAIIPGKKKKDDKYIYLDTEDNDKGYKSIEVMDGKKKVVPLPLKYKTSNHNNRVYVSAPSGAGKSTFTGTYIKHAKKILKPRDIILFSRVPEDKPLDKHDPVRIELDEGLFEEPITNEELENCIVVFDDVDTIRNKLVKKVVQDLRGDLLETGRHFNANIISTSHILMNGAESKVLINEATLIVIFPSSISNYHRQRFYQVYQGLDKEQIKTINKIKSRWLAFGRGAVNYMIWENGAMILD